MVVIDAVARLLPESLGNSESALQDSFVDGLLDCPHYTRPEDFQNEKVPVPAEIKMANIIDEINNEQLNNSIPDFGPGDTVIVNVKIKEGTRERTQAYEGIVIAKRNRGLHSDFTVRKISYGEGVERVFQTHSPMIDSVVVKRRGAVRRAKLYYLRELTGRAARIKEKLN
ncbi:UNVERIFIED_CONTAM: hypothetical protein GTU68_007879 [Idotea baltica]|nr:hypothetical protein [Idotea baltica]